MDSKNIGYWGEEIACRYLENKGYKILERNYVKKWEGRVKKGEIDIIAKKDDIISFVEVKAARDRVSGGFLPEDRVNFEKQRKLAKLAETWLLKNRIPLDSKWQIDVVSVKINLDSKKAKVRHFENI